MNSTDEDMERLLLRRFFNNEWDSPGAQSEDQIFEKIGRPNGWRNAYFTTLSSPVERGAISAILERMASDGLLLRTNAEPDSVSFYEVVPNVEHHPRYHYLYPSSALPQDLQRQIQSVSWSGLATRANQANISEIKLRAQALQQAILQSDADIGSKTDAIKRVEAVMCLMDAPNVPWREVVGLLNHPAVTAFMVALNLIQFIIGLAHAQTH